ncbi:MAG: hypothetical protein ABJN34_05885 [Litoreibacter sp.]|uniref:hypothetical protein n=1 Tax=Litoreibacter sp. TaxID=1969459 RepID=UPI0032980723
MEDILELDLREPVRVDPDRLVELCVELGEMKAEQLITTTMEELANGMMELDRAFTAQDVERLIANADTLVSKAQKIGMTTFSRVADDVASCARASDSISLAATLNRLRRIADRSLSAVWDMQDLSG